VLAGHRDSVFRNLGDLKLGDLLTVKTSYGDFVYEVHKIRIVAANDRTVIVPTPDAVLTLSTCYPFRFIGNAPKRYIVQAGLVIGEPVA
jgi:sortase A